MPDQQSNDAITNERAILASLVQHLLDAESIEELVWTQEPIHGGVGGSATSQTRPALERFQGTARVDGEPRPWSLVRKTLQAWDAVQAPGDWFYWKREAEVYRSGWLSALPGGLRGPICYRTEEPSEDTCWIWMEDLADHMDRGGHKWSLDVYNAVARHLGEFSGAYLDAAVRPHWPWLTANRFRDWDNKTAPVLARLPRFIDHTIIRDIFPPDWVEGVLRLWPERQRYYAALDRLPQTICHLDAFCRNLFPVQRDGRVAETIAIDWAFVGTGALGEEIAPLFWLALTFCEFPAAAALDEAIFTGYLDGLRAAEWRGDPDQVRLGYTLTMLTRHGWPELGNFGHLLHTYKDLAGALSQFFGIPYAHYAHQLAVAHELQLRLIEEALDLVETMPA